MAQGGAPKARLKRSVQSPEPRAPELQPVPPGSEDVFLVLGSHLGLVAEHLRGTGAENHVALLHGSPSLSTWLVQNGLSRPADAAPVIELPEEKEESE